jgi:hypothetical protein
MNEQINKQINQSNRIENSSLQRHKYGVYKSLAVVGKRGYECRTADSD